MAPWAGVPTLTVDAHEQLWRLPGLFDSLSEAGYEQRAFRVFDHHWLPNSNAGEMLNGR